MAVLAKMVVQEQTERFGAQWPEEHFTEEHDWPPERQRTCNCERPDGIGQVHVKLTAVYEREPGHENHAFWTATPNGSIELTIENPVTAAYFETGAEYYVEIRKARK